MWDVWWEIGGVCVGEVLVVSGDQSGKVSVCLL